MKQIQFLILSAFLLTSCECGSNKQAETGSVSLTRDRPSTFSPTSLNILTWNILGREKGIARMIGANLFSVVIGLSIAFIYRKEVKAKQEE